MKHTNVLMGLMMLFTIGAYAQGPGGHGGRPPHPPEMTDAQKACFTANGLVAPGDAAPLQERPAREVMEKVDACLEKNGLKHRGPPPREAGDPASQQNGSRRGPPPPPPAEDSSTTTDATSTSTSAE